MYIKNQHLNSNSTNLHVGKINKSLLSIYISASILAIFIWKNYNTHISKLYTSLQNIYFQLLQNLNSARATSKYKSYVNAHICQNKHYSCLIQLLLVNWKTQTKRETSSLIPDWALTCTERKVSTQLGICSVPHTWLPSILWSWVVTAPGRSVGSFATGCRAGGKRFPRRPATVHC